MILYRPINTPDDYLLGGWSVSFSKLEEIAQNLHQQQGCDEARLKQFFLPMLNKDVVYNFSELLLELYIKDSTLLGRIINQQASGEYLFKDIRDLVDFTLGAGHIRKDMPEVKGSKTSKDYFLDDLYTSDTQAVQPLDSRPCSVQNEASGIVIAYEPQKINLTPEAIKDAYCRLLALNLELNGKYPLSALKDMLKNGINENIIKQNIIQISNPIELRLATLFPDQNGRKTILVIIPYYDPDRSSQYTKTYLQDQPDVSYRSQLKNMNDAIVLYQHYNIVFKVTRTTDELFQIIPIVAKKNIDNKLPFIMLCGHGLHLGGQRMLGLVLGENYLDETSHDVFNDKTNIPPGTFDSLSNGQLVFKCCNQILVNEENIVVARIANKLPGNIRVIASTQNITQKEVHISVDQQNIIHVKFFNETGKDITYYVSSPAMSPSASRSNKV